MEQFGQNLKHLNKLKPFKWDSKSSNANSNPWNEIQSIQMHILAIEQWFYCKFDQNLKHSNEIQRIRMQILTIQNRFEVLECKFKLVERDSNPNSNHLKGIRSIQMQILTIRKGFTVFECKFEPVKRNPFRMVWIYIWMLQSTRTMVE